MNRTRDDRMALELAAIEGARLRVQAGANLRLGPATPPRLARASRMSAETGAPLAAVLDAMAASARDRAAAQRAVEVAAAQPKLVAWLLGALPLLLSGVVGMTAGAWPTQLRATAAGRAALWLAIALQAAGAVAVWLLLRGAHRAAACATGPGGIDDDEVVDLVAAALLAGRPAGAALRDVARHDPVRGAALRRAALAVEHGRSVTATGAAGTVGDGDTVVGRVAEVLTQAGRLGASPVTALHALAGQLRADASAAALARAQRLPVLLTVPTALLLLPATVVLAGAPLLLRATSVLTG